MKNLYYYQTAIGRVGIAEEDGAITNLFINKALTAPEAVLRESALLSKAAMQLSEYLSGGRSFFDLPLAPAGTPWQKTVWQALLCIPFGETRSYRQIAESVGRSLACRAVGQANHQNPIMIIVPCHRVVGANGRPIGYGGGILLQKYLLDLEKSCLGTKE